MDETQQTSGVKGVWQRSSRRAGLAWESTVRWTRRTAMALFALAIIAGVAFIVFFVYRATRPDPGADLDMSTSLTCSNCEQLLVTGVIDGDSLDTNLGRVRLYGADTADSGSDCHDEAIEAVRQLSGSVVRAESGPRLTDPFDRRLFYLYTESGRSIDELLIRNGLAFAQVEDGQHRDFLLGLERETAAADRGCLWR